MERKVKMKQMAIYGKDGTGKSTTAQNLTTAFSIIGNKILLVRCDLKTDSTRILPDGLNHKKLYKNTI